VAPIDDVVLGPDGRPVRPEPEAYYDELVRTAALSVGRYVVPAGAEDPQQPHTEDEVYVVVAGRATFESEDDRRSVAPGSTIVVPAGRPHRFVDVTEDLVVTVVFAPPEGAAAG
jgi:mannose-6-phosphate isomerase-like protein (cupin superfamily)